MKTQRISHLTAEQVHAVFSSDRFLDLTDSQLAALHHRSEQLQAQQWWTRARRRRRTLKAAAVVVVLVALAPFWQVVLGVGAIALIWALLIAVLWDAVQRVRASIAGRPEAAGSAAGGQEQG